MDSDGVKIFRNLVVFRIEDKTLELFHYDCHKVFQDKRSVVPGLASTAQ